MIKAETDGRDTDMLTMNHWLKRCFTFLFFFLLVAPQTGMASDAASVPDSAHREKKSAAAFSFDSLWFYRDGTRVIPELGKRWLTVVFDSDDDFTENEFESNNDTVIQEKAKALLLSHDLLVEYLYDPNLAEGACFFRMRDGLKPEEIHLLIDQLNREEAVAYVQPTLVMSDKTFAFFNSFQMTWKTGIDTAEQEALLTETHVVFDENLNRYEVDVTSIPFFKALNLLAEDIRVLRTTPYLVEIKPSIAARLSLSMSGGNIGDSIPFTLTIIFTDRVIIDPSSLATLNLRPSNLQKELFDCTFDPYDYTKAVTKSPIIITGRVQFYAPGEFTLPAVTISYTCPSCADNTIRTFETDPVLFKVSSMIPADQSTYRLIVPSDPLAPEYALAALHQLSRRYLLLAMVCSGGLLLCVAWLLFQRHKIRAERDLPKERKKDELLAEQLRNLLRDTPTAPHWIYLGEVGSLLRHYLVVLYGIDEKYQGGSGTQFMETVEVHLPRECIESLRTIFTAIDNGVSLESAEYQDLDQLQREILQAVDQTAHNSAKHG